MSVHFICSRSFTWTLVGLRFEVTRRSLSKRASSPWPAPCLALPTLASSSPSQSLGSFCRPLLVDHRCSGPSLAPFTPLNLSTYAFYPTLPSASAFHFLSRRGSARVPRPPPGAARAPLDCLSDEPLHSFVPWSHLASLLSPSPICPKGSSPS